MNGDEIRRLREARGWTQADLAREVGVGHRTIGNWERGETVPKNRTGKLEQVLRDELRAPAEADPIRAFTDLALLSELMRRAVERP
jgi:transcriptional regulator with XRE-family HTH domain